MNYSNKEFEELKKERDILLERKADGRKLTETLLQLRTEYMKAIGELHVKDQIIAKQEKQINHLLQKLSSYEKE